MIRILSHFTSFQEVPNHLSLCFSFFGCPHRCKGCSWEGENKFLTLKLSDFEAIIKKYYNFVSCVCFLGGEWEEEFESMVDICKRYNLTTCLYTGLDEFNLSVKEKLDFLKIGHYNASLGGLDKKETNQKFIDMKTGLCLNELFWKTGK